MAEVYALAWAGLKWSYDEYGVKGAAAFLVAGLLAYYLVMERFREKFEDVDVDADAVAEALPDDVTEAP
ncbi:hypothetical protein DM867_11730 [Halosegnis rubeus]|jgi:hypothetical protein|uniref:Uncharacterized protein n=1 Tax=Halosegnis rubeus TaxID=2212850 RepID=A0A5N5U589_9EURY|nr:hypothetical protein [Halosegnis rubeus]KAB7512858.1 hypothetical protein DM867_11730 [Halosegnis rubeus]KAB7512974.1 hypothetical protein DMP03_13585 [Halosegnis rubeus]KAB7513695.1 hypothetical protein DP108_12655 [Halosegnis rubeus]